MIDENLAAAFGMPELTVITDYDITPELAEKCYYMGEVTYYADIPVDLQTYKNKFNAIPDFCFVFIHKQTREPVGYFINLPLTSDAIKRYMKNELSFDTIQQGDLQRIQDESVYNIFFDSKVVYKQYRTPQMAKLVFTLLVNAIIERARGFAFCNYILIDVYKEFSKKLAETMQTNFLTKHKYTNSKEGELWGAQFDYKNFKGLSNYNVLEFAYNNLLSKEIMKRGKDLWAETKLDRA
jgi:hypothetical protein